MLILLTTIHITVCLFLILVVLLQQGKGADLSVFGGGSTQAVFGARGAATLLHKLTVFAFIGFIVTTIGIGLVTTGSSSSLMRDVPVEDAAAAADEGEAGAASAGATGNDPAADGADGLTSDGAEPAAPVADGDNAEPAPEAPATDDGDEGSN